MSKRSAPRKKLSIVVEPSHRLITDDTDNNHARVTGRIVLTQPEQVHQPVPVPPSPAPSSLAFTMMTPELSTGASSTLGSAYTVATPAVAGLRTATSARNIKQLALSLPSATSSRSSLVGPTGNLLSVPPSPSPLPDPALLSSALAPTQPTFQSSLTSDISQLAPAASSNSATVLHPLPPSTAFSSLAQRRRRASSVVSLPPILATPLRTTTDSSATTTTTTTTTSNTSTHQHSRPPSIRGGRAEEDGYGYSYASSVASNPTNTVGLAAPAPYLNGPIQILPGIWLGCEDNARDFASLKRCGIGYVLNVAKEIKNLFGSEHASSTIKADKSVSLRPPPPGKVRSSVSTPNLVQGFGKQVPPTPLPLSASRTFHKAAPTTGRPDIHYLHLPWSHGQADLVSTGFPAAMTFVDEAIKRGKGVLVHCQCGVSRSATLVIALVMRAAQDPNAVDELKQLQGSMHAAYAYVKEKSIAVGPNMSLIYQLLDYERHLSPKNADHPDEAPSESSLRSEEEEWSRMRKQMEDEEEREREEREQGLQSATTSNNVESLENNLLPAVTVKAYGTAPWTAGGSSNAWTTVWNGFGLNAPPAPGKAGSASGASSIISGPADDEEARDLDRQMEERMVVRRKSSAASFASSVSLASSNGSGNGGLAPAHGASSSGASSLWKSRFNAGHCYHNPQRVRAGSIDSNFTKRSMVSLEEEEEEVEDGGLNEHEDVPSSEQQPGTDSPQRVKKTSNHIRTRTLLPPKLSAPPPLVLPRNSMASNGTDSSRSASGGSTADEDEYGSEPFTSPPLESDCAVIGGSRDFHSHTGMPSAEESVRRQLKPLPARPQFLEAVRASQDVPPASPSPFGRTSFFSDTTPRAKRSLVSLKSTTSSSVPGEESHPPTHKQNAAIRVMEKLSSHPLSPLTTSFRRLSATPPSGSGASSLRSSATPVPPPSAPATKTSFGASETGFPYAPPRRPSSSRSNASSRASLTRSYTAPSLAVVPPSPPVVQEGMEDQQVLNSPMVPRFFSSSVAVARPSDVPPPAMMSPTTPLASVLSATAKKAMANVTGRASRRPAPLPLVNAPSESAPAYVLSSHRSSSSITSLSSVTSSTSSRSSGSMRSLRNKLLGRFKGAGSESPSSGETPNKMVYAQAPLTATPHQTLFIFPPSPTSSSTGANRFGGTTPSTLTLTTNPSGFAVDGGHGAPIPTPTPTLSTFRMSRTSSISASSVQAPTRRFSVGSASGGWMGAAAMAPTTACSRVDVRGWVGL